jgi:hypothetical protein
MHIAKLTSKNQLTLPKAAAEALGRPTHFRVLVAQGNLVLIPARLTSAEEVCATLARGGMAPEQVEAARRLLAGRKGGRY